MPRGCTCHPTDSQRSFAHTSLAGTAVTEDQVGDVICLYFAVALIGLAACVVLGGGIGALLRFWLSQSLAIWFGSDLPYGTLCVNILGSFAVGAVFVFLESRNSLHPAWRAGLINGLLGAFTTFSAFSLDTLLLIEADRFLYAVANIALSVVLCLAACGLGMRVAG